MQRKTTFQTLERQSIPILSALKSTDRTSLASVICLNKDNTFPQILCFVFYKGQELSGRPTSKFLIKFSSVAFLSANLKFLESETIKSHFDNPFGQDMVSISDKPFLSARQSLQMPLSRFRAFGLKLRFKPLIFSFDVTKMFAIKEFIITGNNGIDNPSINTENRFDFNLLRSINLTHKSTEDSSIFGDTKSGTFDFAIKIFKEMFLNLRHNLNSAFDGGNGQYHSFFIEGKSPQIKSDRRIFFLDGQSLEFNSFEHITRLVSGTLDKRTLQSEILSNFFVSKFMQFIFIESVLVKSNSKTKITGVIIFSNSLDNFGEVRQFKFNYSFHRKSLDRKVFKPYGIEIIMETTSSSHYNINYHFVWCPKYRKGILKGDVKDYLKNILETICISKGWKIIEMEIMPDHIHLFLSSPPYESATGIIKILKNICNTTL